MKRVFMVIPAVFFAVAIYSQRVEYTYDATGNVTSRKVIVMTRSAEVTADKDTVARVQSDFLDKKEIKIYPNPTSGILYIKMSKFNPNSKLQLFLFDLSGRCIMNRMLREETASIDISPFNRGIYILRLQSKEAHSEWKIIKK